jgi:hypothetical protein
MANIDGLSRQVPQRYNNLRWSHGRYHKPHPYNKRNNKLGNYNPKLWSIILIL